MTRTNTTTQGTQSLRITPRTESFVQALKALQEAESAVLTALTETYGDEQGTRMTNDLPFEEINEQVLGCMRVVILENLNDNPMTI